MTKYMIKLVGGFYLANHPSGHFWTLDVERSSYFDTVTGANAYAIMELGLSLDSYTIEPMHVLELVEE